MCPRTFLTTLVMGKSNFIFDWIFFILTGNKNNQMLDEFDIGRGNTMKLLVIFHDVIKTVGGAKIP